MNSRVNSIIEEARKLTPQERAELADAILDSLVGEGTAPGDEWIDIAIVRGEEMASGRVKGIDVKDIPELTRRTRR